MASMVVATLAPPDPAILGDSPRAEGLAAQWGEPRDSCLGWTRQPPCLKRGAVRSWDPGTISYWPGEAWIRLHRLQREIPGERNLSKAELVKPRRGTGLMLKDRPEDWDRVKIGCQGPEILYKRDSP